MSTVGMSVAKEYDAALALLDLQSNPIRESQNERYGRNEPVEAAQLLVSCFITPNVAQQPNKSITSLTVNTVSPMYAVAKRKTRKSDVATTHSPKRKIPDDHELTSACHEESSSRKSAKKDNVTKDSVSEIKTRDVGTQTEENRCPIIATMELSISQLREKIKSLEEQIGSNSQLVETIDNDVSENDNDFDDDDDESYKVNSHELTTDDRKTPEKVKTKHRAGHYNVLTVLSNRNVNANADDLVPIGDGNALIPSRIFRHIDWNSYTNATRKLLTAIFPRRILATHSLTGKPSPAFPNKPAKKMLDPALVRDIVQTVVERCCVPENVVRTSITTKCADESKMFRTRQNKNKRVHTV